MPYTCQQLSTRNHYPVTLLLLFVSFVGARTSPTTAAAFFHPLPQPNSKLSPTTNAIRLASSRGMMEIRNLTTLRMINSRKSNNSNINLKPDRRRRLFVHRGVGLTILFTAILTFWPFVFVLPVAFAWNQHQGGSNSDGVNRKNAASCSSKATTVSAMANSENDDELSCQQKQRVVVIGANGQTGFRVVRLLHENDTYQPVAMIRELSQSTKFDNLNIPWFVGDLELGSPTAGDLEGAHAVIFAAGAGRNRPNIKKVTIDYLGAVRSIAAAQETASVQRFLLLSGINSDPQGTRRSINSSLDDLDGPLSAWHRLKAHSETYLKESHLHGRQLDWTILCPGRLVDDDKDGENKCGKVKLSLIHGEDDLKADLTDEEKVAAVKRLPGSHDGMTERLCVSRGNTALTLVGLLSLSSSSSNAVSGKSITVVNGILPVDESLATLP